MQEKNLRMWVSYFLFVMLNLFQHLFDEIPKQVRDDFLGSLRDDNMDEFVVLDSSLRSEWRKELASAAVCHSEAKPKNPGGKYS